MHVGMRMWIWMFMCTWICWAVHAFRHEFVQLRRDLSADMYFCRHGVLHVTCLWVLKCCFVHACRHACVELRTLTGKIQCAQRYFSTRILGLFGGFCFPNLWAPQWFPCFAFSVLLTMQQWFCMFGLFGCWWASGSKIELYSNISWRFCVGSRPSSAFKLLH